MLGGHVIQISKMQVRKHNCLLNSVLGDGGSVVQYLPSVHKTLGSILGTTEEPDKLPLTRSKDVLDTSSI